MCLDRYLFQYYCRILDHTPEGVVELLANVEHICSIGQEDDARHAGVKELR
jgi:hypothetical protein